MNMLGHHAVNLPEKEIESKSRLILMNRLIWNKVIYINENEQKYTERDEFDFNIVNFSGHMTFGYKHSQIGRTFSLD